MSELFQGIYTDSKMAYETYRNVFNTSFNIAFGYPRKDTFTTCDEFQVNHLDLEFQSSSNEKLPVLTRERQALSSDKELHVRKAEISYSCKASAEARAKVYHKRQLTCFTFRIHVLSTDEVYLYTYDKTVAKKVQMKSTPCFRIFC
ncbi:hypothetical protein PoB_006279500 [Plakobranchus ocellatus]|uniref:Uncharacterized protein n=1 Tax=Plakobranchus ocellatus TaxID=259542 RepID=A0AAV4CWY3_9GAST|nr:hypothetical protein PoB_006279500 [Plakobranchus ocellatus]